MDNAIVVEGRLEEGYTTQGPYDVILVSGAVEVLPQTLLDQLANGGRLATVIDDIKGIGKAMLFVKRDGNVSQRVLFDASVPRLPGFKTKMGFVF